MVTIPCIFLAVLSRESQCLAAFCNFIWEAWSEFRPTLQPTCYCSSSSFAAISTKHLLPIRVSRKPINQFKSEQCKVQSHFCSFDVKYSYTYRITRKITLNRETVIVTQLLVRKKDSSLSLSLSLSVPLLRFFSV